MKKITVTDTTLAADVSDKGIGFREKIDIACLADRLNVDVIEQGRIGGKSDLLYLHTISPLIMNAVLSCNAGLDEKSAAEAYSAISEADKKRLFIEIPASVVQMEYMYRKKPAAMLELCDGMTKAIKALCDDCELVLLDATRAEKDFLYAAIDTAIGNGVMNITLCDSEGTMIPDEMYSFVSDVISSTLIGKTEGASLTVSCPDTLCLSVACAIAAIRAGADGIKTTFSGDSAVPIEALCRAIYAKGDVLGISVSVEKTALENISAKIKSCFTARRSGNSISIDGGKKPEENEPEALSDFANAYELAPEIRKLGYELSDDDCLKVFEEYKKVSAKKKISLRELDAIVAGTAMQVPPTYKLKSFVINCGNIITATAHIELEKDGNVLSGISIGDGPVDAAFLAIEKITGHHYELDDFQIQSLTEGREAVGSSVVKLRSGSGKIYSGKGVSTDIIGAGITAYINALNKICFEEM